jgi:putative restriction endonuclease
MGTEFNQLFEQIKELINRSKNPQLMKKSNFKIPYKNCHVEPAIGQTNMAHIIGLCFLFGENKISQGIYPYIAIDRISMPEKLIIGYGVSVTNDPLNNWTERIQNQFPMIEEKYPNTKYAKKYPNSLFFKEYNISEIEIKKEEIKRDIDYLIEEYIQIVVGTERFEELFTQEIEFYGSTEDVVEGRKKLVSHYLRERNRSLIKKVKEKRLEVEGELRCEVCGFSFVDKYGELGENFIEGHHRKPISEMEEGEKTSMEDISLVCSNCHRMIHKKEPAKKIEELKIIVKDGK